MFHSDSDANLPQSLQDFREEGGNFLEMPTATNEGGGEYYENCDGIDETNFGDCAGGNDEEAYQFGQYF